MCLFLVLVSCLSLYTALPISEDARPDVLNDTISIPSTKSDAKYGRSRLGIWKPNMKARHGSMRINMNKSDNQIFIANLSTKGTVEKLNDTSVKNTPAYLLLTNTNSSDDMERGNTHNSSSSRLLYGHESHIAANLAVLPILGSLLFITALCIKGCTWFREDARDMDNEYGKHMYVIVPSPSENTYDRNSSRRLVGDKKVRRVDKASMATPADITRSLKYDEAFIMPVLPVPESDEEEDTPVLADERPSRHRTDSGLDYDTLAYLTNIHKKALKKAKRSLKRSLSEENSNYAYFDSSDEDGDISDHGNGRNIVAAQGDSFMSGSSTKMKSTPSTKPHTKYLIDSFKQKITSQRLRNENDIEANENGDLTLDKDKNKNILSSNRGIPIDKNRVFPELRSNGTKNIVRDIPKRRVTFQDTDSVSNIDTTVKPDYSSLQITKLPQNGQSKEIGVCLAETTNSS